MILGSNNNERYDVVSVGEILIDFLPGEEEGSYIRNPGGAPANFSIAAARNGLKSGIFCKAGDDDFGHFLMKTLKENEVEPLCEELCKDAITTMAFVSLTDKGERSFTFARKPGADSLLALTDIDDDIIRNSRLVHAGSCSLSKEPAASATVYALKRCHEEGKLVSFDINYRDTMWENDKAAATRKVNEILDYVDLLKVSEEEIDMLGGEQAVAELMAEKNISCVVETLGGEGAKCFYDGEEIFVEGIKIDRVADTTGAGDAFWGGFISCLLLDNADKQELDREKVIKAARYGNVSGALCVQRKGAIAALPTRVEIEEFFN